MPCNSGFVGVVAWASATAAVKAVGTWASVSYGGDVLGQVAVELVEEGEVGSPGDGQLLAAEKGQVLARHLVLVEVVEAFLAFLPLTFLLFAFSTFPYSRLLCLPSKAVYLNSGIFPLKSFPQYSRNSCKKPEQALFLRIYTPVG